MRRTLYHGVIVADNDPDILAQFQEFLEAKKAKEEEEANSEDFEIEIWDENGRGVRTRRSHAKPFLQSLGIDVDPDPTPEGDDKGKAPAKGKPVKPGGPVNSGMARKYFTKPQGK
jgi:hypothetical protein